VPQTSTLRNDRHQDAKVQRTKRYDFYGRTKLTLYESTDSEALSRLAQHFGVAKITLETFREVGGKRVMCGRRKIFPPPANA